MYITLKQQYVKDKEIENLKQKNKDMSEQIDTLIRLIDLYEYELKEANKMLNDTQNELSIMSEKIKNTLERRNK